MRRREEVLVDDLDGSLAEETVKIIINGDEYRLDLSGDNATRFWGLLAPWLRAAQKIARRRQRVKRHRGQAVVADPEKVRGWARETGIPVNMKGYPARDVELQYIKAWVAGEVSETWQ